MTKNSPVHATGAHISIIGHATKDELQRYLSRTEMGNGFANRFLWVCVKRSKLLPDGGRLQAADLEPLVERLKVAVVLANGTEEIKRDDEAQQLWHREYEALSEGRPGLLGAVISRAEAQVTRLAALYALLDCSAEIRKVHLEAALDLWRYCEDSCRFIFGETLGDPLADELLDFLKSRPGEVTRTEIRDHFTRNRSGEEIGRALVVLEVAGLAVCARVDTNGRPAEKWRALSHADRGLINA